jgi:hypothetical protein
MRVPWLKGDRDVDCTLGTNLADLLELRTVRSWQVLCL